MWSRKGDNTTLLKLKGDFTYRNLVGRLAIKIIIIPQLRKTFLYALQLEENSGGAVIRPWVRQVAVVEKEPSR